MALLDIRQRTGWLFMAVVVGHILLISTQVSTRRGVPVLEALTFGVVRRGAARGHVRDRVGAGRVAELFRTAGNPPRERGARSEVAQLRVGLQQERALAEQSRMLQKLLDMKTATPLETTAATVIAGGASPDFRTVTIDKGTGGGLRPDMAVISPAGVVGRIILPTGRAAKVQLLIDRDAAAGAVTERSRAQGVVVGTGTSLRLDHVPGTADIKIGDRDRDLGYRRHLPEGVRNWSNRVDSIVAPASYSAVIIRPAVEFSSLESVLVVLTPPSIESGQGTVAANGAGDEGR